MKAIILAAGYATRLYPLTINRPKALLPIAGKPILDYIVDEVETIDEVTSLVIISNDKFYENFKEWKKTRKSRLEISVLNDNTTDDTNKLGAVGDINFAIDTLGIDEDILVMAGDNIFTFHLKDFADFYKHKNSDTILAKRLSDINDLKRMGNAVLDDSGKVLDMVEKPENPPSDIAVFAVYMYKKETLPMIKQYLGDGGNPDAPGFFPSWLHKKKDVYAYLFDGECYDIGTPESYKEVNEIFEKIK
ncbi:MAG: nucleotidyltransferase family protein [Clostridia bacterium]|nr:nucleotidyltransferase family protein [Clostridia bacterium]